ncbi:hypothetical protein SAMN04488527_13011 [Aliiroseovarius crassostreae]|uniref:DUF4134 domain-containing protein n=1 Tax=Aliiroseovarius crassostreae TaxID=154981 RepID=A0A0P7KLN7_9RHOB|nr:hypothetical protein [Aliiroseovarius crassostreae]KPN62957.1 hypothetical protein AKJ29_02075 [Aliiroseovarius crassostreae]SFU89459.1 hypothetical protein SAMN04488527_13011 [Aliiroseovarius crassostreae]
MFKTTKRALAAIAAMPLYATTYAMAQVADVRGALEINRDALDEVAASQINEDGIEGGIVAIGNIVLIAAGCIGVIMAAFGISKLYAHYKEGEQARGSTVGYWAMVGIGGLMTIVAIVTAFVPTLFLDGV